LPGQARPQIEVTSLTHMLSHVVSQQYESCAQMAPAHALQVDVSMAPMSQSRCEHAPPLELDELLLELDELPLTQTPDWHTPDLKPTWQGLPSCEGSGRDPHAPLQVAVTQGATGQLRPHAPQSMIATWPQKLDPPVQGSPWLRFTHVWSCLQKVSAGLAHPAVHLPATHAGTVPGGPAGQANSQLPQFLGSLSMSAQPEGQTT
jgi:hypothetical protein